MPLTFTCLDLYSPNANIYTGLLFKSITSEWISEWVNVSWKNCFRPQSPRDLGSRFRSPGETPWHTPEPREANIKLWIKFAVILNPLKRHKKKCILVVGPLRCGTRGDPWTTKKKTNTLETATIIEHFFMYIIRILWNGTFIYKMATTHIPQSFTIQKFFFFDFCSEHSEYKKNFLSWKVEFFYAIT